MPKHIAKWNPARDAWEDTRGGRSLFCGHSDVYSGTFPASGMTRNGVAYELQTWEHRTGDTGYSSSPNDDDDDALLRTPCAAEAGGGPLHPDVAKERGQTLRLTGQILAHTGHLLPTPTVGDKGGEAARSGPGYGRPLGQVAREDLLPTPRTSDTNGPGRHGTGGMDLRTAAALLPTPTASRVNDGEDVDQWEARRERIKAKGINGNGMGEPLTIAAQRLLPTPRATDGTKGGPNQRGSSGDLMMPSAVHSSEWGTYAPSIKRWERVLGRPAPVPTVPDGRNGKHRLSAPFVEWMMGLPEGWVTEVPISRNEQLKALGNGVVPQQCTAALRDMLASTTAATAAA